LSLLVAGVVASVTSVLAGIVAGHILWRFLVLGIKNRALRSGQSGVGQYNFYFHSPLVSPNLGTDCELNHMQGHIRHPPDNSRELFHLRVCPRVHVMYPAPIDEPLAKRNPRLPSRRLHHLAG